MGVWGGVKILQSVMSKILVVRMLIMMTVSYMSKLIKLHSLNMCSYYMSFILQKNYLENETELLKVNLLEHITNRHKTTTGNVIC